MRRGLPSRCVPANSKGARCLGFCEPFQRRSCKLPDVAWCEHLRRNSGDGTISGAQFCALRPWRPKGSWKTWSHSSPYRLLIADDHPLFRGALREAVGGLLERVDVAEAGTFDELVELLERGGEVDLVLLDLTMPGARGLSGLIYMRAQFPGLPVIVVSATEDPAARRCMDFGASGFMPKSSASRPCVQQLRMLGGGVLPPTMETCRSDRTEMPRSSWRVFRR